MHRSLYILIPLFSLAFLLFLLPAKADAAKINISRPMNNLGLVGYWTFDGPDMTSNVADKSGQGNHGSLIGQTSTTTAIGKVGQALEFDGSDDEIRLNSTESLTGDFAVSIWFNRNTTSNVDGLTGDTVSGTHLIRFSGNATQVVIRTTTDTVQVFTIASSAGVWGHLTVTRSSGTLRVYKDGVESSTGGIADAGTVSINRIGNAHTGSNWFDGKLDDARIYNRALSAEEIRHLYNSGASTKINASRPIISDGLVGHWTFDGKDMVSNVADVSGQGNHGFLIGQTSTTTTIGKVGQALEFDGVDDFVNAGSGALVNTTNPFTFSAWIKPATNGLGTTRGIIEDGSGNNALFRIFGANQLQFWTNGNGTNSSGTMASMEWSHAVVTYDGTTVVLYINGSQDGSEIKSTSDSGVGLLTIGEANDAYFSGSIDDVRIYNRALSAEEIRTIYNATAATHINASVSTGSLSDGLVGHWTFDGPDMLQNVADVSGQGNHGSLIGQTSTTTAIGKKGQALSFDGSNDYISVPNSASFDSLATKMTLSAWITSRQSSANTLDFQLLLDKTNGNDDAFRLMITDNGNLRLRMPEQATPNLDASATWAANEWFLITATWDGTTRKIYKDGQELVSDTASSAITIDAADLWIAGDLAFSNSDSHQGDMDDVRIYNRALSADEIRALYNLGR